MSGKSVDDAEERLKETPLSTQDLLLRLHTTLLSCSSSIEANDFRQSEISISQLAAFLNSVSDAILSELDNEASENQALQVLTEIHRYLNSPSLNQAVIDGLSFELPKAVSRFACVSRRCLKITESVIDCFVGASSARDMVTILCEALDSSHMFNTPSYFVPLLNGLAKVFVSIQRRHFDLIKEALPVILNVLMALSSETDGEDTDFVDLFDKSITIAKSIEAICVKLDGEVNEKLRALLGLLVLQIMALASISVGCRSSSCLPLIIRLSHFLPYCSLSYSGLITGLDVDTMTKIVIQDDEDDYKSCFSYVKHGASLAVIWGRMFGDVTQATEENLTAVKDELQSNQTKRWLAMGMLKHIFSCGHLSWELKKHAINFLLWILDGDDLHRHTDEHIDCSGYMPGLFGSVQAVEIVIIYAPDAALRRNAFDAFKRCLADIPSSLRFDILKALIQNSDSSSMIAILLDRVREEMRLENCQRMGNVEVLQAKNEACWSPLFWSPSVLELMEFILRPPQGGPPLLLEYGDAVLAALNLYRFVLITESTGKTNYSGVVSKKNLQKAYNDWLLPLRTLVTCIAAENNEDHQQLALDTLCALNPIELVLYRCIELVEENLKCFT